MKLGRPSSYTPDKAAAIIIGMLEGLTITALTEHESMPARSTVYLWASQHPEFADALARARILQTDLWADEITHIVDTELDPQRARVRSDARLRLMAAINPKRYGQKIDVTVSERPSIKDALRDAHARLGRPVNDQQVEEKLQVIDPLIGFLVTASDNESHDAETDQVKEAAELEDLLSLP